MRILSRLFRLSSYPKARSAILVISVRCFSNLFLMTSRVEYSVTLLRQSVPALRLCNIPCCSLKPLYLVYGDENRIFFLFMVDFYAFEY